MTTFYSVVEGDPLDSGGNSRVTDGLDNLTIRGKDGHARRMAFLGQKAWCERCNSVGEIVAAAKCAINLRMFDAVSARYQALGDDRVLCKCPSLPRIISVYGRRWMIFDDSGNVNHVVADVSSAPSSTSPTSFDEQVKSVSRGVAMDGYPYFVETADGRTSYGRTDANGNLPRIETESDHSYTVYWGDDALARQQGN